MSMLRKQRLFPRQISRGHIEVSTNNPEGERQALFPRQISRGHIEVMAWRRTRIPPAAFPRQISRGHIEVKVGFNRDAVDGTSFRGRSVAATLK